jgi:hypothetical protein
MSEFPPVGFVSSILGIAPGNSSSETGATQAYSIHCGTNPKLYVFATKGTAAVLSFRPPRSRLQVRSWTNSGIRNEATNIIHINKIVRKTNPPNPLTKPPNPFFSPVRPTPSAFPILASEFPALYASQDLQLLYFPHGPIRALPHCERSCFSDE